MSRAKRRRAGLPNYRIVRYADDFVALVAGTQAHAEALREDVATVLAPMGLRLSAAKTKVCHIDHRGRRGVGPAPDDDGHPLSLPGRQHRHTMGKENIRISRITMSAWARGEPDAWRHARPVRRAGWGNVTPVMASTRPSPTQLIDAEHDRVRGDDGVRAQVEPTDVGDLPDQLRIGREPERLGLPGLDPVRLPRPSHPLVTELELGSQQPARPVRHREPLRWRGQRRGHHGRVIHLPRGGPERS